MAIKPLQNEQELLSKIADGDQNAFTKLFNWYYQPLGQAIFTLTESIQLTEEIIQDAFVKIWLRRESLASIDNFSSYLFILCRNHAFSVLKKLAKEKKLQPVVEQHLEWESDFADLENPSDFYRELIQQVVDRLPSQQRKIYQLSRQDRLKYDEIAAQLGISSETVKTQVYNAVKFIRKELGPNIGPCMVMVLTSMLSQNS